MIELQADPAGLTGDEVKCVVDAVSVTLSWIGGEEPAFEGDETEHDALEWDGIIGCISLVGNVEWNLTIALPQATATALVGAFAGCPVPFDSPDIGDGVGELSNLVAGQVKANLAPLGMDAEISLPQVFRGAFVEMLQEQHSHARVFSFVCSHGPFWVAVVSGGRAAAA